MAISEDEARHLRDEIRSLKEADKEKTLLITDLRLLVTEMRSLVSHIDKSFNTLDIDKRLKILENQGLVISAVKWGAATVGGAGLLMALSFLFSRGI